MIGVRTMQLGLVVVGLAVLIACGAPQTAGSGSVRPTASIAASPNPVPAGAGLGSTTVAWKTGDGSQGQVYVSEDGGTENLFDQGTDGNKEAPWIRTGSTYEFRLYSGTDHKNQLGSVQVTRAT